MSVRDRRSSADMQQTLRTLQEEYRRGIEEAAEELPERTESVLVFRLGGERYAVPARHAREVLRLPRIVPVPALPQTIRGIINLRGEIVAVSDLRPFLGLPVVERTAEERLIVAHAGAVTTALLVEKVEGLRTIAVQEIAPLTEGLAGFPREAAQGQFETDEEVAVLLRLDHILQQPEFLIDMDND